MVKPAFEPIRQIFLASEFTVSGFGVDLEIEPAFIVTVNRDINVAFLGGLDLVGRDDALFGQVVEDFIDVCFGLFPFLGGLCLFPQPPLPEWVAGSGSNSRLRSSWGLKNATTKKDDAEYEVHAKRRHVAGAFALEIITSQAAGADQQCGISVRHSRESSLEQVTECVLQYSSHRLISRPRARCPQIPPQY